MLDEEVEDADAAWAEARAYEGDDGLKDLLDVVMEMDEKEEVGLVSSSSSPSLRFDTPATSSSSSPSLRFDTPATSGC